MTFEDRREGSISTVKEHYDRHLGAVACVALLAAATVPAAVRSWLQIAHAGGGLPLESDNNSRVLEVFADHIARDDPVTKRVLFDLSYVPAPGEGEVVISSLALQMRRIGIDRFLFGSDYNVLTPAEAVSFLERLGLTEEEEGRLRQNCAPWVCPDTDWQPVEHHHAN